MPLIQRLLLLAGGCLVPGLALGLQEPLQLTGQAQGFVMDGQFDSPHYEIANTGMKILAAVRDGKLYVATWSPAGQGSDHFLLVTDRFDPSEPAPWSKHGRVFFNKSLRPHLAGDTTLGGFHTWYNGGAQALSAKGAAGQALEGEIDLVQAFGHMPEVLFLTALAYGLNPGGTLNAQCPAPWPNDGGAPIRAEDVEIMEMQPVRLDSIRDEDGDGHHEGGRPLLLTSAGDAFRDANYDLRRFFVNELAAESHTLTVRLYPQVAPGASLSQVEVFTNLNRRDFARLDEDPGTVTTASTDTYFRAHPMTPIAGGGYEITLPVHRCGAYRLNARYRVNNGPWVYVNDQAQRRDCAIVVSPHKALTQSLYEVNPTTVEATSDTFAGRSTFRDLHLANTDRPDVLNLDHYTQLGVNHVWLQPIHPIGLEAREIDGSTSAPYEPGSPYAVRDYWSVAPALGASNTAANALAEFVDFVQALDGIGVGVMMDGTFNHSAPDAVFGQGALDLFPWATDAQTLIRAVRPQWYAKAGRPDLQASYYHAPDNHDIAVAPDRTDFGFWTDVREFHFGRYDCLVKGTSDANRLEYLSERDAFFGHDDFTREVWEYFAYYPIYWLEKTGHPVGTPREESWRGIDGLRCDFAQGLPSQFWEYCINRTRSVKWDFLFMAESLDGYREVAGSKRHGVGYRSSRHFDILNENLVFYWRDSFFKYFDPFHASAFTGPTRQAIADRRSAYEGSPLLLNLTGHDEILPHDEPYRLLYGHAILGALDGLPMLFFGQEAGLQNSASGYPGRGINPQRNFARYEFNFGKHIPHFKRWNHLQPLWGSRDWNLQGLYGRINRARLASPALRSRDQFFLERMDTGTYDPDLLAVAKVETPGVDAAQQDVVFAFVNNNYQATANRAATFKLDAIATPGANWFGIQPGSTYNLHNLLAADPSAPVWGSDRLGADLLANGIFVQLDQSATALGQAQYLRLVDTGSPRPDADGDGEWDYTDWDDDNDGLPDTWETAHGLDPWDADGVQGADGDRDGDQMSNREEFLAGTDPGDPASRLVLTLRDIPGSTLEVAWPSVDGRRYRVLRAPALPAPANWSVVHDGIAPGHPSSHAVEEGLGGTGYFRLQAIP
jgi:glycosidase